MNRRCHKLRVLRGSLETLCRAKAQCEASPVISSPGDAISTPVLLGPFQAVAVLPMEGSASGPLANALGALRDLQIERKARATRLSHDLAQATRSSSSSPLGKWGSYAPEAPQGLVAQHRLAVALGDAAETAVRFLTARSMAAKGAASAAATLPGCTSQALVEAYCTCELARRRALESLVAGWRDSLWGSPLEAKKANKASAAGDGTTGGTPAGGGDGGGGGGPGPHREFEAARFMPCKGDTTRLAAMRIAHEQASAVVDRAAREVGRLAATEARSGGSQVGVHGRAALQTELEAAARRYEEMAAQLQENLAYLRGGENWDHCLTPGGFVTEAI
jgi:hypothetical protein